MLAAEAASQRTSMFHTEESQEQRFFLRIICADGGGMEVSMKIMCDTNIFLDVLLDREIFADDSSRLLSLCEEHKLDGFISASCITDIFYLVRKYTHSTELAYNAIGKVLEIVKVCSVTNNDILLAFQRKAKDFEDCLVATCAKSIHCDCIVTRNKKDFDGFGILLLEPSELLLKLQ